MKKTNVSNEILPKPKKSSVSCSSFSNDSVSSASLNEVLTENEPSNESHTIPVQLNKTKRIKKKTSPKDKIKNMSYMLHLRPINGKNKKSENSLNVEQRDPNGAKHKSDELNFDQKELLKMDMLDRLQIMKWLKDELNSFTEYLKKKSKKSIKPMSDKKFLETNDVSVKTYFQLTSYAASLLKTSDALSKRILKYAPLFDFSETIKGNGYHLVVRNFDSCCRHLLIMLIKLNEKRMNILFQMSLTKRTIMLNSDLKELQAWVSRI
jgi:hypothetical protein